MPYVGAAAAVVSAGTAIAGGIEAKSSRIEARRGQQRAQEQATARAVSESRRAQEAFNAANRRRPDVASLLTREQSAALKGPGQTFLTGAGGVDRSKLLLGRTSTLGGG